MSLYSDSTWAICPSGRLSMAARTPSSMRLSARAAGTAGASAASAIMAAARMAAGERGDEAAGADVVDVGEHVFEHGLGKARQRQKIERGDEHRAPQHRRRGGAVGKPPAEEIARGERGEHGRDQRCPGIDAAAEIG